MNDNRRSSNEVILSIRRPRKVLSIEEFREFALEDLVLEFRSLDKVEIVENSSRNSNFRCSRKNRRTKSSSDENLQKSSIRRPTLKERREVSSWRR